MGSVNTNVSVSIIGHHRPQPTRGVRSGQRGPPGAAGSRLRGIEKARGPQWEDVIVLFESLHGWLRVAPTQSPEPGRSCV